jgi:WD40 repeat protein
MTIKTECPVCGKVYINIPSQYIGKTIRCKECKSPFQIEDKALGLAKVTPAPKASSSTPALKADSKEVLKVDSKAEKDKPLEVNSPVNSPSVEKAPKKSSQTVTADWDVGDTILNIYKIERLLGEGGMGKVFLVKDIGSDVQLAVKSPKPEELAKAGGVETFIKESETWIKLGMHPNIVSCYYVRTIDGIPRVFAEFIDGGSLADWIKNGNLTQLDKILDIAIQFAWGLHFSHSKGLIHRDIKPANVMMTKEGIAKVTDFGLASVHKPIDAPKKKTEEEDDGGMTPLYCSPEQAEKAKLTPKTDMWSWGVSILEMFIGEVTWPSGTVAASVLEWYLEDGPVNQNLPKMPDGMPELLKKIFNENTAGRPKDMLKVAQDVIEIYEKAKMDTYFRILPEVGMTNADSINNRAVSLLDLGKSEDALTLFNETLHIHPYHPESSYNRGLMLWRTGEISDSTLVNEMMEVVDSEGGNPRVKYLLGLAHLERDDTDSALKILKDIANPNIEASTAITAASSISEDTRKFVKAFSGHDGRVNSICLSKDSKVAFSGGDDKTIRLWHVETGTNLNTLTGHEGIVTSVYLSHDGKLIISASLDKTAKIWNVAKGFYSQNLHGYTEEVTAVCASPDGKYAITGSVDRSIKLWLISEEKYLRVYNGHRDEITSLSISKDGTQLLSGSKDCTVRLWDIDTTRNIGTFRSHTDAVNSVCLNPKGRFALSGSSDHKVIFWDTKAGAIIRTLKDHTDAVLAVALSHDGRFAISGGRDCMLKVWDLLTGRCIRTFDDNNSEISTLSFSHDGIYAFAGCADGLIRQWNVSCHKKVYEAPKMLTPVVRSETVLEAETAVRAGLKHCDAALKKGNLQSALNHLRDARAQHGFNRRLEVMTVWTSLYPKMKIKSFLGAWKSIVFVGHEKEVRDVCISKDSKVMLTGADDNNIKLWDVSSGECLKTIRGHKGSVTTLSMRDNGNTAVSGGLDNAIKIWDIKNRRIQFALPTHNEPIVAVSLSQDGQYAASVGSDKMLRLWDAEGGKFIKAYDGHDNTINCVSFSADGQYIVSGDIDNKIILWKNSKDGSSDPLSKFTEHTALITSVKFSADGKYILSGSADNSIKLWEITSGKCIKTFIGHKSPITSVSISSDGRFIISGSHDNTARLWDVSTGDCIKAFFGHNSTVQSVCISYDSRYIVTACGNVVNLWTIDWDLDVK